MHFYCVRFCVRMYVFIYVSVCVCVCMYVSESARTHVCMYMPLLKYTNNNDNSNYVIK